jgi:hypothetical protein
MQPQLCHEQAAARTSDAPRLVQRLAASLGHGHPAVAILQGARM